MDRCKKVVLGVMLVLSSAAQAVLAEDKITVEDVVQHHLDSIATAAIRTATKSRVVEGATHFKIVAGGAGTANGKTFIVSEDRKVQFTMKFPSTFYTGEKFVTDGNKVQVAFATQTSHRSNFGEFVYIQDGVMREGLLCGELSTAWSLLDLEHRKAKLSYEGLKSIDGKQLYDVRYKPQKNQGVEVHLYFEPETFHHVLTVYTMSIDPQLSQGGANSLAIPELGGKSGGVQGNVSNDASQATRQQETRYRIEERFSDFKTADGFTLPNQYTIQFTQDSQGGRATVWEWDTSATKILEKVSLDPRNFEMK